MYKSDKGSVKSLPQTDISFPLLSTEANFEPDEENSNSTVVNSKPINKSKKFSFRKLFNIKEEERLYKLSEMNNIINEREKIDSSIVGMKRVWDAYPSASKENILSDIKRQFSTYIKLPNTLTLPNTSSTSIISKHVSNDEYII